MQDSWFTVKVHPGAGKDVLVSVGPARFEAWVRRKPLEGQANLALVELLARTLGIPRDRLRLIRGAQGRQKVFHVIGGVPS